MSSQPAPVASVPVVGEGRWPHALSHEPSLRVSDVLALVKREFPALTTSKLRFLDNQGLVAPRRTASGYRQYSVADVERLRFVLRQQRDHYRPLTVIAGMLDDLDHGRTFEPVLPHEVSEDVSLVTTRQLAQRANVSHDFVEQLLEADVLPPVKQGRLPVELTAVVAAAWGHVRAGADVKDVRALKIAAERTHTQHRAHTASDRSRGEGAEALSRERDLGEAAIAVFAAYVRSQYDHGGET